MFDNKLNRLFLAIGISCFVWFMLFSLGIFEFDYFPPVRRFGITGVYSLFCFATLAFNFFVLQDRLIKKGTYGSSILWSFWLIEGIALSNFLLTTRFYKWEDFSFNYYLVIQTFTIALSMIIIPLFILIHYVFVLKTRLSEKGGQAANDTLKGGGEEKDEIIHIESEYKNDSFRIDLDRLLYIRSADNYVDVCYTDGDNYKVSHKLIRNSLTAIEQQQISPQLVRCHRSYIVNRKLLKCLKQNNTGNYIILNGTNEEIPLSRKYKEHFTSKN